MTTHVEIPTIGPRMYNPTIKVLPQIVWGHSSEMTDGIGFGWGHLVTASKLLCVVSFVHSCLVVASCRFHPSKLPKFKPSLYLCFSRISIEHLLAKERHLRTRFTLHPSIRSIGHPPTTPYYYQELPSKSSTWLVVDHLCSSPRVPEEASPWLVASASSTLTRTTNLTKTKAQLPLRPPNLLLSPTLLPHPKNVLWLADSLLPLTKLPRPTTMPNSKRRIMLSRRSVGDNPSAKYQCVACQATVYTGTLTSELFF